MGLLVLPAFGVLVALVQANAASLQKQVSCVKGYEETPAHQGNGLMVARHRSGKVFCGGAPYFTGDVHYDSSFTTSPQSHLSGATVYFSPASRTAWHTHALGQTLIITSGVGWIQAEGGPVVEVRPGDVIYTPPGVKHWHGATPTSNMSHIAISQIPEKGAQGEWFGPVSDADYKKGPAS